MKMETTEKQASETEQANKAYTEMVPIQLTLARRFYDFIQGYLQFFGKDTTIEDFCRDAVFDAVKLLYQNLDLFRTQQIPTYISDKDWFMRWDNLTFITVPDDEKDAPHYEVGVEFGNKEFLGDIERVARRENMSRDEFIRDVLRKQLQRLDP